MNPYVYIKKEIILGNLKEGDIFNEADVSSALNISRTPVREAVLKLKEEGYLTIIPRKGTIVSKISYKDIKELYDYRLIVEGESIKKVALVYDLELARSWKEYFLNVINNGGIDLENDLVKPNYLGFIDSDYSFHISLAESLNNKYILREITSFMDISMRIRYLSNSIDNKRKIEALKEHIEILDAIIKRNDDLARGKMINHLSNSIKRYNF